MNLPYVSPRTAPLIDDAYSAWHRHVDAGRIATTATISPEHRAKAEADAALFRGYARGARALAAHQVEIDRYYRDLARQAFA